MHDKHLQINESAVFGRKELSADQSVGGHWLWGDGERDGGW